MLADRDEAREERFWEEEAGLRDRSPFGVLDLAGNVAEWTEDGSAGAEATASHMPSPRLQLSPGTVQLSALTQPRPLSQESSVQTIVSLQSGGRPAKHAPPASFSIPELCRFTRSGTKGNCPTSSRSTLTERR